MKIKNGVDVHQISRSIAQSSETIDSLLVQTRDIASICSEVVRALKAGRKIMTVGNGGSAAEAMHMAEEIIGRFRSNRKSLPAISLTADCAVLTCISNDYGYDSVFSRQVEGLGQPGDVLVLFSTSGNSVNMIKALLAARKKKVRTVCVLGKGGGALAGKGDRNIIVDCATTERVQEAHQVLVHLILDAVEDAYPSK